ncbi:MAG: PadR family transcriptional regulator [Frankia sp.]
MARGQVPNLLGLAVLAYLTQRPMHPYELSRTLRDHGDDRSIKFSHGSLYTVVEQLARAGFVVAQETSREGHRPERTTYALTPEGRAELTSRMRQLIAHPRHEYPAFVAALSLVGALHPDEVVGLLRERLDRLRQARDDCQAEIDTARGLDVHPMFLIEEDYRIALLVAETAFCDQLIERITDSGTGWRPAWAEMHRATRADLPLGAGAAEGSQGQPRKTRTPD